MSKLAPDQHLIDALWREFKGEATNGQGKGAHANPSGSNITDQAILAKIFGR